MANKGSKPSDRRAGKRRDRDKRVGTRIPELGYYLIVTDIKETEKNTTSGHIQKMLQYITRPCVQLCP